MKASCWRPVDGRPAGGKKKKKAKKKEIEDTRWLSVLVTCMLRASDKPTSQDGCEKVERNARVYPSCRSETGTHTDSCTSETHIKSRLLAAAKGYKHKPPQLGPPRLQTSFLCSFKQHVLINKLLNKSIRFLTHRLSHKLNKHMQLLKPGTTLKTHSDPCAETGWFTQKGGAQSAFPS